MNYLSGCSFQPCIVESLTAMSRFFPRPRALMVTPIYDDSEDIKEPTVIPHAGLPYSQTDERSSELDTLMLHCRH